MPQATSATDTPLVAPAEHEQPRVAGAVLSGVECSGGSAGGAEPAQRVAVWQVPVTHVPPGPHAECASS